MKFKTLTYALFFAMGLLVISCAKDEINEPEATCVDGIQNGNETGVDCGGDCDPCATCDDGVQNGNETDIDCGGDCDPCPTCTDGIQNGNETAVDCGGDCDPCPTCDDGVQNGNETGIDCGGDCDPCPISCENTTYENSVKAIINNSCNVSGCHDGTTARKPFTNYTQVRDAADFIKKRAITDKTMPPSGPLSQTDMDRITCWLNNGKKEN